jgi:hypothetical protein
LHGISEESWLAYLGVVGGKAEADNILRTRVIPDTLDPLAEAAYLVLKTLIDFIRENKPKEYKDLAFLKDWHVELNKHQPQANASDKEHQSKIDKLLAKRIDLSKFDSTDEEEDKH